MQDKIKKIIIITIVALSISVIAIYVKTNNDNNLNKKNKNNTINKEEKLGNLANTDTLEKEVSIKEVREKLEKFCKKLGFNEIIYYSDNYEKTKDKAEDIRINVIAKKVVDGKEYTLRLRAIYLKNKNNHLTNKIQHVKISIYNSVNERFEV